MQADGVIDQYAIGGAVGATFYLEPVATLDIDVFVSFKKVGTLLTVSPIESGILKADMLDAILVRHGLPAKWEQFADRFLKGK
jgi:hypothetical protein